MNALLLTVLTLSGAGGGVSTHSLDGPAVHASSGVPCDTYGTVNRHHHLGQCIHDWCGPMPQSCYNPSFGC